MNSVRLMRTNRNKAASGDGEAIHRLRMAVTKLRAAVAFFSPVSRDKSWSRLKQELAWLNALLGEARDLDVELKYARRKRYRDWAKRRKTSIAEERAESHRRLAVAICSKRTLRLVADLSRWITNGPWTRADPSSLRAQPSAAFARRRLRHWRSALLRKAGRLAAMNARQLHKLRKKAKRYRYMMDAIAPPARTVRQAHPSYEGAKRIHRALGDLRDLKRFRKTCDDRLPGYSKRKRRLLNEAATATELLAASRL